MRYLTVEEVILIHEYVLQLYGGVPGIRSIALLESAVHRPVTSFGGSDLYLSVFDKAASLIHAIIKNHPFVDGNKRTAIVSGIVFLRMNKYKLVVSEKRLIKLALDIADSEISLNDLSEFLKSYSVFK